MTNVAITMASPGIVIVASTASTLAAEVRFPPATTPALAMAFGAALAAEGSALITSIDPGLSTEYGPVSVASVAPAALVTASPPPPPTTTTAPPPPPTPPSTTQPALNCPFDLPDCSGHGTPAPPCTCACEAGWVTSPTQDLAAFKFCGVNQTLGGTDGTGGPTPAPSPPPGAPPPPPPSTLSKLAQLFLQLKTLSTKQWMVVLGGLALAAGVGYCCVRLCMRCGACGACCRLGGGGWCCGPRRLGKRRKGNAKPAAARHNRASSSSDSSSSGRSSSSSDDAEDRRRPPPPQQPATRRRRSSLAEVGRALGERIVRGRGGGLAPNPPPPRRRAPLFEAVEGEEEEEGGEPTYGGGNAADLATILAALQRQQQQGGGGRAGLSPGPSLDASSAALLRRLASGQGNG